MELVYIGLGSNLGKPVIQLKQAIEAVKLLPESRFIACSSLYGSKPMGPQDQPDYVNAVAAIKTELAPKNLLHQLQHIEQTHGRERKGERWGPRTLDLDILLFGQQVINTPELTVPHYGMQQREFVLYPLAELTPELVLPHGQTLKQLLTHCPLNGLQKLPQV